MFEFLWLWAFLLLPLPWLIYKLSKKVGGSRSAALKLPTSLLNDFVRLGGAGNAMQTIDKLQLLFISLAWLALLSAIARPVWVADAVEIPVSGRNLMLAVDLSGSMQERDFELSGHLVDRLVATKAVAGQFIRKREGDRIGLILFGDRAYLQAPLTFDRETVTTLLNEAALGLAGEKTAIGDAIGLAIKQSRRSPEEEHVLVLMTDGANTAGVVSPHEAAVLAAQEKLKIYTVGIGSEQSSRRAFGFNIRTPRTDLDERTLQAIAEQTGGQYFRARDINEFQKIYDLLDELEPIKKDVESWRPQEALFRWPLLMTLFFFSLFMLRRRVMT
jgi:Ca-activated chloride channel family protein